MIRREQIRIGETLFDKKTNKLFTIEHISPTGKSCICRVDKLTAHGYLAQVNETVQIRTLLKMDRADIW
jgi:hypothetical protein